ncbi:MAG: histidine triad nucleotide-binding protein [Desulfobacterales bacterium]|nr:histidine triad nucleotide-binding protein [Desulfobacterales bacterium]
MGDCLFCKIAAGNIPANKLYEDEDVLAFWDIAPQTPKHFLVIPKKHFSGPSEIDKNNEQLVGKMMRIGAQVAAENEIGDNFRVIFNNGPEAGQIIFHIHMHILGGRPMNKLVD